MSAAARVNRWVAIVSVFTLLALHGCTLRFVADYDDAGFNEVLSTAKAVDVFYGRLLATADNERQYAKYRDRYVELEADIRSLWLRNAAREDNRDSEQIIQDILDQWSSYRARHAERNTYSTGNAELDRDRLQRMFASAARAEAAKKREE